MKKTLTSLATLALLSTSAYADFTRVEIGGGLWSQNSSGTISGTTKGEMNSVITYTDNSLEDSFDQNYIWAYLKHPIPIIPNIRFDYTTIDNKGVAALSGQMYGFTVQDAGNTPTTLNLTQYDFTPYYNLLDNTFWVSVDLGIDIRMVEATYDVGGNVLVDNESVILPLLYSRFRTEIPMTELGIEAVVKWISDGGDNTVSDIFIKADYTFNITPIVQPGIEIGYRIMTMESKVEDGDTTSNIDLTFEGIYFGAMLRF